MAMDGLHISWQVEFLAGGIPRDLGRPQGAGQPDGGLRQSRQRAAPGPRGRPGRVGGAISRTPGWGAC
eukprot:14842251-Alexandrium_andersonii.AAC.1